MNILPLQNSKTYGDYLFLIWAVYIVYKALISMLKAFSNEPFANLNVPRLVGNFTLNKWNVKKANEQRQGITIGPFMECHCLRLCRVWANNRTRATRPTKWRRLCLFFPDFRLEPLTCLPLMPLVDTYQTLWRCTFSVGNLFPVTGMRFDSLSSSRNKGTWTCVL